MSFFFWVTKYLWILQAPCGLFLVTTTTWRKPFEPVIPIRAHYKLQSTLQTSLQLGLQREYVWDRSFVTRMEVNQHVNEGQISFPVLWWEISILSGVECPLVLLGDRGIRRSAVAFRRNSEGRLVRGGFERHRGTRWSNLCCCISGGLYVGHWRTSWPPLFWLRENGIACGSRGCFHHCTSLSEKDMEGRRPPCWWNPQGSYSFREGQTCQNVKFSSHISHILHLVITAFSSCSSLIFILLSF